MLGNHGSRCADFAKVARPLRKPGPVTRKAMDFGALQSTQPTGGVTLLRAVQPGREVSFLTPAVRREAGGSDTSPRLYTRCVRAVTVPLCTIGCHRAGSCEISGYGSVAL